METKLLAEADKFSAEARLRDMEAAKVAAEARAAVLAADLVEIAAERERWRRQVELQADSHHGVMHLAGLITAESAAKMVENLIVWRRLHPEATVFTLVINSGGGTITDGIHLFDTLRALSASGVEVTTVASGLAASMAAILTQAGDRRVIMGRASFMLHEASAMVGGRTPELEDRIDWIRSIERDFADILAERSTLDADAIMERWERKDWWLRPSEALALGFFDRLDIDPSGLGIMGTTVGDNG